MELVHDNVLELRLRTFAQGDIGQDFCCAAEYRRIAVDRCVTSAQPDIIRTELPA